MARRDYYNDPDAPKANSVVPAVTAVVRDPEGRVLLIHRTDNDRWALPGGVVELGESVAETAVREVREETGIEIEVLGLVGVYSDPKHVIEYENGEIRQQFSICFQARPLGGTLRPSDESTEARWVVPSDIKALNVHPTMRLRINHGLDEDRSAPYIG